MEFLFQLKLLLPLFLLRNCFWWLFLFLLFLFLLFFFLAKELIGFNYRFFELGWVDDYRLGEVVIVESSNQRNYLKDLPFCCFIKQVKHCLKVLPEFVVFEISRKDHSTVAVFCCKSWLDKVENEFIVRVLIIFFIKWIFLFPLRKRFLQFFLLNLSFLYNFLLFFFFFSQICFNSLNYLLAFLAVLLVPLKQISHWNNSSVRFLGKKFIQLGNSATWRTNYENIMAAVVF